MVKRFDKLRFIRLPSGDYFCNDYGYPVTIIREEHWKVYVDGVAHGSFGDFNNAEMHATRVVMDKEANKRVEL